MEAKDLRIKNFLFYNGEAKQVSSIHSDETIRFKDGDSSIGCFNIKNKNIQPIPLNEELLLKLGFTKYSTGSWCKDLKNNDSYIAIDVKYGNGTWLNIDQEGQENTIKLSYVKNVHQLQNLYFALTGEELNVKL